MYYCPYKVLAHCIVLCVIYTNCVLYSVLSLPQYTNAPYKVLALTLTCVVYILMAYYILLWVYSNVLLHYPKCWYIELSCIRYIRISLFFCVWVYGYVLKTCTKWIVKRRLTVLRCTQCIKLSEWLEDWVYSNVLWAHTTDGHVSLVLSPQYKNVPLSSYFYFSSSRLIWEFAIPPFHHHHAVPYCSFCPYVWQIYWSAWYISYKLNEMLMSSVCFLCSFTIVAACASAASAKYDVYLKSMFSKPQRATRWCTDIYTSNWILLNGIICVLFFIL